MILDSSLRDPTLVHSPLDRAEAYKDDDGAFAEAVADELAKWNQFEHTRDYALISQLADPHILQLQRRLESDPQELVRIYPDLPSDLIQKALDEVRGELRVWKLLKYGRGELERRLVEYQENRTKEKARQEERGDLPESAKKYV